MTKETIIFVAQILSIFFFASAFGYSLFYRIQTHKAEKQLGTTLPTAINVLLTISITLPLTAFLFFMFFLFITSFLSR